MVIRCLLTVLVADAVVLDHLGNLRVVVAADVELMQIPTKHPGHRSDNPDPLPSVQLHRSLTRRLSISLPGGIA